MRADNCPVGGGRSWWRLLPVVLAVLVVVGILAGLVALSPSVTVGSPPGEASEGRDGNTRLVGSRQDLISSAFAPDSTRHVLRDPAMRFDVTIPPRSVLQLGFGIRSGKWQLDEVEVTVTFRSAGEPLVLFRQRVTGTQTDQWQDETISLAPLAGKQGTIELDVVTVRGSAPPPEAVLWTVPIIEPVEADGGLNVILLSIDTLRADHVGSYGAPHDTSPHLDRLAREGVRFRQAIAPSIWTLPSHASMLTGVLPSRHGAVAFDHHSRISGRYATLAELLWDAGYNTAGFTEDVFVGPHLGFARGFDRYDAPSVAKDWVEGATGADIFTRNLDEAKQWLERHRSQRFFMFLHTYTVHMPYAPPPPYDTMFDPDYRGPFAKAFTPLDYKPYRETDALDARTVQHLQALYDGEIRYTDHLLGEFFDFLASSGLAKRTCVIVTSDHGDEFKEHGNLFHRQVKLTDELLRVPLIVWCPGRFAGGQVVEQPVSIVDITPTVLDLVGAPIPAGLDGVSLEPSLRGERQPSRTTVSELDGSIRRRPGNLVALRTAQYKFLQASGGAAPILYDLQNDPGEKVDVSAANPEVVRRFAGELAALALAPPPVPSAKRAPPVPKATVDPGTLERMRNLGYAD